MIQAFGLTSTPRKELPPAVDDVSFEARAGRVTALLGASGAGKTTALGLMLELQPGRGITHFRGRPLHRIAHPAREVGVLLGDVPGHPGRTVRGHLRMLCAAAGVPAGRGDDLLESVGLVSLREERLGTLSRGQDRRLGLACALLADPHALVLDDPAAALSAAEARWLHGALRAHADRGGTVLFGTADPKEAARTADHVVTLECGRVVADQEAARFRRTRLRPRVAVRSPHAPRLAALLAKEARTERRSVEVVREGGNRLAVYGSTCADIGDTAFRNGILVHRLADEVGDMGPGAETYPPEEEEPGAAPGPALGSVPGSRSGPESGHASVPGAAPISGAAPFSELASESGAGPFARAVSESGAAPCSGSASESGAGPVPFSGSAPVSEAASGSGAGHVSFSGSAPVSEAASESGAAAFSGLASESGPGPASGATPVPASEPTSAPDRDTGVVTDRDTGVVTDRDPGVVSGPGDAAAEATASASVAESPSVVGRSLAGSAPAAHAIGRPASAVRPAPAGPQGPDPDPDPVLGPAPGTPVPTAIAGTGNAHPDPDPDPHPAPAAPVRTASPPVPVPAAPGAVDPASDPVRGAPPPDSVRTARAVPVRTAPAPEPVSADSAPAAPAPPSHRAASRVEGVRAVGDVRGGDDGLGPPIRVRSAPSPLRPLRYELHRTLGIGTGFLTGAVVLVVSAVTAVVLARIGHSPQPRLLVAWPAELPLPPAALGAGLLGALAFGDEFRHPALAADRGTVPRRLGLLGAKLVVSALTALLLAVLTLGCDAELLYLFYGPELTVVPADWPALSAGWAGLVVGCAWAGLLAAGVFRSTTAGLAAVLAVPVLVVPLVQRLWDGPSVRSAAGLPMRLREALLTPWPFGGERYVTGVLRLLAQPVGGAMTLSVAALLCAYLLTTLRGRTR
ncbi:ATP-binding cassette domain-containing protein [Streptomyces sp. SID8352]|uniref:ATP-binding cassette domain-containing protein n=1 Tax=Streptomyces sp. SID8352 TaxID=2690338 RepID=UPI00136E02C8|nr:ATP-binding cassette domain-containing protein [Streptomyces sp. SID8352]